MATLNNPAIKKIIGAFEKEHGMEPGSATKASNFNTRKSWNWFRKYNRKNWKHMRTSQVMRDQTAIQALPRPGDFYFYVYDPKYKDELPYYDKFPLTLVLSVDAKGWLGLNFHYLAPVMRVLFLAELATLRNEQRYRRSTRIMASWDRIKAMSNSRAAKHSVKRYLFDHARSKFIKVDPKVWGLVVTLPLERFEKASQKKVWSDI